MSRAHDGAKGQRWDVGVLLAIPLPVVAGWSIVLSMYALTATPWERLAPRSITVPAVVLGVTSAVAAVQCALVVCFRNRRGRVRPCVRCGYDLRGSIPEGARPR